MQPSWEPYVAVLGETEGGEGGGGGGCGATYRFGQWDIKGEGGRPGATTRAACCELDLCLISNVLVYCTDEDSAEVLRGLRHTRTRRMNPPQSNRR